MKQRRNFQIGLAIIRYQLLTQIQSFKMSFDKIKSLWRSSSENNQESFIDRTQSFIVGSFRRSSVPLASTAQFQDYLASIPKIKRGNKKPKQSSTSTLKPQLLKRCLEVVQNQYFNDSYKIDETFFDRRIKVNTQRQQSMQEQLDEVQVCLFNQISSRFDQILSVLRTVETLDLLVVQNQRKLKYIRQNNFNKVITVSLKQRKMTALIRKKKHIQSIKQYLAKLKQYREFQSLEGKIQSADNMQVFYNAIPVIKKNVQYFQKLACTNNIVLRIQEIEQALKRSFSDKVNEKIFQYLKKDIPYQTQFWRKNINDSKVMEDRQEKDSGLLDQSTIIGEQESVSILPKRQQAIQTSIVEYIKKGWEDGEYSVSKLKIDIDTLLKSKHNAFMLDFRNFCDEICKKNEREVENPSLTNLLKEISIVFCVKVYNYFFDIHKSMFLRFFFLNRKVLDFINDHSKNNLTIDQKQKLSLIAEGFANSGTYLSRIILQKLIDILDTKLIHEGIDISEIKQVIGVIQNADGFLEKQISLVATIPEQPPSFLQDFFNDLQDRYPRKLLQSAKKRKLIDYLNKMHKNALTIELKQSLQNEIWQPTDIPTFYYDSLHYLITGQSLNLRRNKHNLKGTQTSMMYQTSVLMDNKQQSFYQQPTKLIGNFRIIRNDIIINGQNYKVTQTLLLLLEILEDYMTLAQNFPLIKSEIGIRINEVIRSYNVSSCQLIVHAGAVALQKIKTKNITSRHLALSSLCVSFILYIMECLEKRVEIMEYQKLKQSLDEHVQIIIKKLHQILMYKATSVKNEINLKSTPSKGTQTIVNNTKILLQILSDYYEKRVLNHIFTKQVLKIYVEAIDSLQIQTRVEAEALKDDVAFFFGQLKGLEALDNDFSQCRVAAQDIVRRAFQEL